VFAALAAFFATPYLLCGAGIIWLLFHKIAMAGFIGLFVCIVSAKLLPVRAIQVLTAISILAIIVGWNIYTPDGTENAPATAAATPAATPAPTATGSPYVPYFERQHPTATPNPVAVAVSTPTPDPWDKPEFKKLLKPQTKTEKETEKSDNQQANRRLSSEHPWRIRPKPLSAGRRRLI
jgi:hypothetical protein